MYSIVWDVVFASMALCVRLVLGFLFVVDSNWYVDLSKMLFCGVIV